MGELSDDTDRAGDPSPVALHVRVDGRVQGVGFRRWAEREAHALGLAGWVRNLGDGAVEVLAAGPRAHVDAFEGRLRIGPPHADVACVTRLPPQPETAVYPFRIRRDAP